MPQTADGLLQRTPQTCVACSYNCRVPSSIRRDIGQLLIGSLPSTTIPPEMRSLAREFSLGGVTLFARNIEAPEQVAELAYDLQSLSTELPLWVAVDQEGGRVARLRAPFTEWPPMAVLGRSGDAALAYRFAAALASELKAVGVSLDYAPVLDIHTNSRNPVIGDRALAETAEAVAALGAAIVRGLQESGVAACGKHFPGHGDTSVDSHLDLPIVEHPPDRLRRVEFVPFREAIRAGVATIMTAHILVPSLDEEKPATLSRRVVYDLLRDELNFEGVILSDDLEMKALANSYSVPEAAVQAILAGCDGVLICRALSDDRSRDIEVQAVALEALVHAVEDGTIPYKRLEDALARQRRAKERFLGAPVAPGRTSSLRQVVGCDAHRRIAEEMSRFL
ncbi:MAG: beta-N-acetylhexosaminidase [Acidobacteria bacterium]|nr:beta-N-acetylhexosaminidase [Acidobacteriota bacterium]